MKAMAPALALEGEDTPLRLANDTKVVESFSIHIMREFFKEFSA